MKPVDLILVELSYVFAAWPAVLKAFLLASLQGAFCYAFCRMLEKKWSALPSFIAALVLTLWLIAANSNRTLVASRHSFFWLVSFLTALACLAAYFHRRSGGASKKFVAALLLMAFSTNISIVCGFAAFHFQVLKGLQIFDWSQVHYISFGKLFSVGELAYFFGALLYPLLAPLAVFVWQHFRAKPGVEVPLQSGVALF